MMEIYNSLPEKIQNHLKEITGSSGLPDGEESLEMIAANWVEKRDLFRGQIAALEMEEVKSLDSEDPRGALLLTYSGSLISLGTLKEGRRWMEYASIKLRGDVPDILKNEGIALEGEARVDHAASFTGGPLRNSSALFTIACCGSGVPLAEQEKRIEEATLYLTNGFVKINRNLTINQGPVDHQFNMKSMVRYVAGKNNITQAQAGQVIGDFLKLAETGLLLGERVSLGTLGRLLLKVRPARKARVGRHPQTGEELTIKARPPTPLPRFSFSKYIKDKAALVDYEVLKVETENGEGHD